MDKILTLREVQEKLIKILKRKKKTPYSKSLINLLLNEFNRQSKIEIINKIDQNCFSFPSKKRDYEVSFEASL